MAFFDKPIVSNSSERSEKSVNSAMNLFSQRNGFICREDSPDFGVDLQVELIESGKATNNRFVIQIKSAQRLHIINIDGKDYISYTFPTSRLGYLCNHLPGYGLVLLYDDSTDIMYYGFIEDIVGLLNSQKGSSEWQSQEYVNIHIPVENILNEISIQNIHNMFVTRFKNHSLLINQYGNRYSIPVITSAISENGVDFSSAEQIAKYVQDYGALLFNNRDFEILLGLIGKLTLREIKDSLDVRFIVAITLAETGRFIDADYYLRKLLVNPPNFSKEKIALIRLYIGEIDFRLGRIDIHQYLCEVRSVLPDMELTINRLSVQLRINSLEIFDDIDRDVLMRRLYGTISDIKESNIEQHAKNILILHAAGYLHQLGISIFSSSVTRLRILEKTIGHVSLIERCSDAQRVLDIVDYAVKIVEDVWQSLSEKEKESRLGAHVRYRLAEMFFSLYFNIFMLNCGSSFKDRESLYLQRYSYAITAFNYFVQNDEYDEAYSALTTAFEIGTMHDYLFENKLEKPSVKKVYDRIEEISAEMGKSSYQSLFTKFVEEELPQIKSANADHGFTDMTELDIEKLAKKYAEMLGLPENRVENIIADMKAVKYFKNIFPNKNAELLQDLKHTERIDTLYASPIIHIGYCSLCGYRTTPSTKVEDIVNEYYSSHGKLCSND